MKLGPALLIAAIAWVCVGCSNSASTTADVSDAAASIDASKRGIQPEANPGLSMAGGAPGTAGKPHGKH